MSAYIVIYKYENTLGSQVCQKQQLKEEAERLGMTQSELIRSLIARLPEPTRRDTAGFTPWLCFIRETKP